jgi:hypothetical protein
VGGVYGGVGGGADARSLNDMMTIPPDDEDDEGDGEDGEEAGEDMDER